ncbi:MAG: hypothetical protein ACFNP8_06025, partial [Alloprevotella sp.]
GLYNSNLELKFILDLHNFFSLVINFSRKPAENDFVLMEMPKDSKTASIDDKNRSINYGYRISVAKRLRGLHKRRTFAQTFLLKPT